MPDNLERIVPSFKAEFAESEISEVLTATEQILRTGQLVLGPYTKAIESAMSDLSQTEYAVAVNSGSTALEIIYRSLGVNGQKVLIPTNTNFATAAAAVYAGAHVEFYDNGLYPDTDKLLEQLTPDVSAVVVVHIGGYITPYMGQITTHCNKLDIPLIEDAAHAHGASQNGIAAGHFGRAGAFSFFPTKTLTTGEGGMIATDDETLAKTARKYRDQGKNKDGITHEVWGNSWRMTEIGAALGLAQIKNVAADTQRRANVIERYMYELADTALEFPLQGPDMTPSGYKCIAMLPSDISRQGLKKALSNRGVLLGKEVYEKPLHLQPIFATSEAIDYPLAEDFAARHICLPLWRFIEDADVTKVISEIKNVLDT